MSRLLILLLLFVLDSERCPRDPDGRLVGEGGKGLWGEREGPPLRFIARNASDLSTDQHKNKRTKKREASCNAKDVNTTAGDVLSHHARTASTTTDLLS